MPMILSRRFALNLWLASPSLVRIPGAQADATPDDALVVPGQRIGRAALALPMADQLRLLGPKQPIGNPEGQPEYPAELADSNPFWIHRWDHLGLRLVTNERDDPIVRVITTLSERYRTDEGIGAGATRAAVETAYGRPSAITEPTPRDSQWTWDALGLSLRFRLATWHVGVVSVFRPGTARERWRF
jgi:hypothetical protein